MEIISLKTPSKNVDNADFPHFLFDGRIFADVEEDEKTDKEEFILLPDENI